MPKRKCFFEEPPKKRICFRISTGYTTSSKTGVPFRVHPHAMAATGGETSRPVGERSGLVKTRTQGRAIGTSAACSPAWLIIQSTTASCTGCAALHAGRGGPQNGPRRMLHVRTASASIAHSAPNAPRFRPTRTHPATIQRTHPSERTPLPSPSPRQSPTNFVVSTTYTHIHRTQAIHYEK